LLFDGRQTVTETAINPDEMRHETTGEMDDGKFYTVIGYEGIVPAELSHSGGQGLSKKEHIVRYSDEELRAMMQLGESKSDWAAAAAMSEDEIEAAIAGDEDEAGMVVDWSSARLSRSRYPS
jgi:hypothetical protein